MHRISSLFLASATLSILTLSTASAAAPVSLGTAQKFAVLGGSTVTSTGLTKVTGDLGVAPGSAVTGFPPATLTGTMYSNNAVALQAQSDVNTAYNLLAGLPVDVDLSGQGLGGLTLMPGVYHFGTAAQLSGALVLDAMGNEQSVFVFQIASTLTTAPGASVTLINGGTACNVFWQVGSSAILDTTTDFAGNVLAKASITLNTGADVSGRLLAMVGGVAMDTNTVSIPSECQCTGNATATNLGPGCSPQSDPILSATPPVYGGPITLGLQSAANPGECLCPIFASVAPVTPTSAGGTGCLTYVDPANCALIAGACLDAGGNWSVTLTIPATPSMMGLELILQAFVHSQSAASPRVPYLFSNGLLLEIGCP